MRQFEDAGSSRKAAKDDARVFATLRLCVRSFLGPLAQKSWNLPRLPLCKKPRLVCSVTSPPHDAPIRRRRKLTQSREAAKDDIWVFATLRLCVEPLA
jgi:hypothetical protein